ncbi:nucleotide pyrophosphohydrolase [Propionispora vibrioides]|jgi:NTP pyrophosphatase (non-canonical NTP hydrolase)|uniref:MazG nucleotide pyrophosphohydrolase domain-containing protein n=1 Tax=Propionispora vibrioides TaxID=112903 RepID=A0A1H8PUP4_9FIRM|nr:nucleotide pyrophosphohydrolase [Propionispora vibrioides]SEO45397.1 hypothetical protein SAMN04490178_10283 [Propionispora vibrioides]
MLEPIYLPKLNHLSPTLDSTLLKIMEEAGELARAVLHFLPYEGLQAAEIADNREATVLLEEVAGELLDVAQTCVTMIFVMEQMPELSGFSTGELIQAHLDKLSAKGYDFDRSGAYNITTAGNFKYLVLPRLRLKQVTLLTTVCKIQEELGELTQFLGKRQGASGECPELATRAALQGCAAELLDVAQCCFTMMYILAESYQVDIGALTQQHVAKLRRKGYCA